MVSFWPNKKKNGEGDGESSVQYDGDHSERASSSHHPHEATERTRLLSPRREGLLDPDDPAVSPYNLWSVRILRYFSILFLAVTFVWWVLLLVSIFVSPPGMYTRGSGFFDFSYTTLTLGNLLVAILFFATPARGQRVSALVICLILLIDMIIIVSVSQLRGEERWIGITSVVWALLMASWTIMTDRVVAWGKKEEEERLTGREESRRTALEWLSAIISTILMVLFIIIVVLLTATLILRARDASLAAPGKKYWVDGNKYEVHLYCEGQSQVQNSTGKKAPTVLFEGAEMPVMDSLAGFAKSALNSGSISRYCWWDRPGMAWSDNAPSPLSAGMAEDALSQALVQAGVSGPYVLASAGIGGIYSRIFASRHNKDIKGILLIDTLQESLLADVGSAKRGFFLWGRGILSPLGIQRIAGALFNGRSREDRVYGRSAYLGGKFIKAKLQESLIADSLSKNEVVTANKIQDLKTPLVVISSGIKCSADQDWKDKQEDLSHITENLVAWDIIPKAPHEVWKTKNGRDAIEKRLRQLVSGK